MGLCCSVDQQQQTEPFDSLQLQQQQYDVGTGVTMMMQRATALVTASSGTDLLFVEAEIRKAKAEGRTVTIENGCLYFDYQLVCRIPPNTFLQA